MIHRANYWTLTAIRSFTRVNIPSCKKKQDTENVWCGDLIKEDIRILINSTDHIVIQGVVFLCILICVKSSSLEGATII